MKGRAIVLSACEEAFLEAHKEMLRRELHPLFCGMFGRDDVSLSSLNGIMKRKGWCSGRNGRFVKGETPHNKGKAMPAATKAKLLPTLFQKGNRPHTYKGPGHESVDAKDGYVHLILAAPGTRRGTRRVLKHVHLWEAKNGPVPDGMCLKCLDGDRLNTDPSNWEAIPRAMLPRLNGWRGRDFDGAAAEVKPAILAVTKLEHAARVARNRR